MGFTNKHDTYIVIDVNSKLRLNEDVHVMNSGTVEIDCY